MNNLNPIKNVDEFVKKVEQLKKEEKFDLSSDEDLSIAVMNLVSIEEHFFFTAHKTEKEEYFDLLNQVRQIRKELLKKLIKEYEGEVWCISKHLLAASMRLIEVGTKQLQAGNKKEAQDFFQKAYNLYSLFWGLNMKLIDAKDIKKIDDGTINRHDTQKGGLLGKLGEIVKRAIDCCIE
jgi:hypothetical protein